MVRYLGFKFNKKIKYFYIFNSIIVVYIFIYINNYITKGHI